MKKESFKSVLDFFRTKFYKYRGSRVSIKELVNANSVYEKCIQTEWDSTINLLKSYEEKKISKEQFESKFRQKYTNLKRLQAEHITIKAIQSAKNSGIPVLLLRFFKGNNLRIFRRSICKNHLANLEKFKEILDHYDLNNVKNHVVAEITRYQKSVLEISKRMDNFNEKEIRLPFSLHLSPIS